MANFFSINLAVLLLNFVSTLTPEIKCWIHIQNMVHQLMTRFIITEILNTAVPDKMVKWKAPRQVYDRVHNQFLNLHDNRDMGSRFLKTGNQV